MKASLIAAIALGTAVLLQTGCTKAAPEQTKAAPEQTKAAPVQTKAERIREIDAQLSHWVPTGRPEDVDKRVTLKAERASLAADLGYSTSAVAPVSAPVVAATPVKATPSVIIAQDSTSTSTENRWQGMPGPSWWMVDATTPGETLHGKTVNGRTTVGQGGYDYNEQTGTWTYTGGSGVLNRRGGGVPYHKP